ncbi:hypothetical protein [Mesorhizobium sp.]|uniref:hypothetical protein n=1 Tax=Mesorhizobium sp. TaxID=1871066 RepID=UPI000FE32482|nr:hypothetical protein [Mesorhizobium sp.]RWN98191.1 MAG: hypothetical protein EOS06_24585 [Mesorhizobium sp.]
MDSARPDIPLQPLLQCHIDWLLGHGMDIKSLTSPVPVKLAHGVRHPDGRLDPPAPGEAGKAWLAFEEAIPDDVVFWDPQTGSFATQNGRVIALGETFFNEAATYSFDSALTLYPDPIALLKAGRLFGAVIFNWPCAWWRLFDKPRIRLADPALIRLYDRWMKPPSDPDVSVTLPEVA